MPKKKLKTKRSKTELPFSLILLRVILSIVVVLTLALAVREYNAIQTAPVLETPETEVLRLPPELKRQLAQEATISASIKVPILMYHYVEYVRDRKDKTRLALNILPSVFDEQIKTLSDAGYTFMTAAELGRVINGRMKLPQKPVLITFDDGHWDLDTDVLPILKKYHAKATAYIIPGFIGGSDFLTPDELRDVIASGLVEIGAHTVHHVALKGKPLPEVKFEVDASRTMLEQNYHIHVVSFAYPYGSLDKTAAEVVQEAGFTTAVSTVPGDIQSSANRFFLFRLRPGARTGTNLLSFIETPQFPTASLSAALPH